jgi:murein DD-endopeptidase MepM/ murein hydrolase activator NlpD
MRLGGPYHLHAANQGGAKPAGFDASRRRDDHMTRALAVPAPLRAWLAQTWLTLGAAIVLAGLLNAGARAAGLDGVALRDPTPMVAAVKARLAPAPAPQKVLIWRGADVDGDGAADFVNPTGKAPRTEDAYGYGRFGASRDGGVREHEGVDWTAEAGQPVVAPISGYVTKIGFAYAGDQDLKYVEVTNPALGYVARIFYVDPAVEVGQAVRLGESVGTAHSLQAKYPGGMTDHVHMELAGPDHTRFDSTQVLTARYVTRKDVG